MKSITLFSTGQSKNKLPPSEAYGVFLTKEEIASRKLESYFPSEEVGEFVKQRIKKPAAGSQATFDLDATRKVSVRLIAERASMFKKLEASRKLIGALYDSENKNLVILLPNLEIMAWLDAVVSAYEAAAFAMPKYGKKKDKGIPALNIGVPMENLSEAKALMEQSQKLTASTNLVRSLSARATNDLTTDVYVEEAKALASELGLVVEFFSYEKLKKMGAGAFCAVAQGSISKNSGILKLTYRGPKNSKTISFVGKGITFDTGGANIKTGGYMYGMNGDMGGSAVALALVKYFAAQKAPFTVNAFLAITDNQLSPVSYRPNDVVTTLSGKTVEVFDTDAEGRMILSDALTLASREKPDLIVDFATLTGSCVRAIGTTYSGGYSNKKALLNLIRKAGVQSGERVWPFPNDPDYGTPLKSKFADLKQCREKGGVDHIEASYFLRQFIENKVPYVHIDLSSAEHEGGLAHVPSLHTGFGVRFGVKLTDLYLA